MQPYFDPTRKMTSKTKWKTTSKKIEDDLKKKNEDNLKKKGEKRRPKKKSTLIGSNILLTQPINSYNFF
jgi:hypothetical protein